MVCAAEAGGKKEKKRLKTIILNVVFLYLRAAVLKHEFTIPGYRMALETWS